MVKPLEFLKNRTGKAARTLWENILFLETLFLIAFIPLYPKIPLVDIKNTWVYIRAEDFVVFVVIFTWLLLLIKRKVSLKTPLTVPILLFWLIGGIATIHAVLIIFPTIANVFPNVAFYSLVRHIEYLSLFFVAYFGIRTKKQLTYVIYTLIITLLAVSLYGFGQKYLGFPAFLTMNEEFAKGIPIHLSPLSRVPSTFAGHYDLAAYLVLIIPIMISLFFGFKNLFMKLILLSVSLTGFVLLFMTVSRVSFLVLFVALFAVLFFYKKRFVFISIPILIVLGFGLLSLQPTLLDRFKSTVSEVDVLVDAKTGDSLGHIEYVPKKEFKDKIVLQRRVKDKSELSLSISAPTASSDSTESAVVKYKNIPDEVPLLKAVNVSTGENLPQGTGYINLYLSPVVKRLGNFYYELPAEWSSASPAAHYLVLHGDFIVKRASAYDLSFTTRFQGEWPKAVDAFRRNILFGSGYGSVSLAVDNNYLRTLAEIGILGFSSFFLIFFALFSYSKKYYKNTDTQVIRSFAIGLGAGLFGLILNAGLIDVFEASKIAFLVWLLAGVLLGVLSSYQDKEFILLKEIKLASLSTVSIGLVLFIISWILFSPILNSYFVADDFTWLRWVADCKDKCSIFPQILGYFTNSDGFFYRPGTKIYFDLMYRMFWLNQTVYHMVSLFLHFGISVLFFLLAKKILKDKILAFGAAATFLVLSGSTEAVYWISSTGHLFNAFFGLLSIFLFILWDEKRRYYFYIGSFFSILLALTFHELGVVFPLFVLAYKSQERSLKEILKTLKRWDFLMLFLPVLLYLGIRFLAHSHWFNGDYSYDLVKLPFNLFGNLLGYFSISTIGPISIPIYETFRSLLREQIWLSGVLILVGFAFAFITYRLIWRVIYDYEKRAVIFGFSFFIISLIPFLGLGNITPRYSYLASIGLILVFMVFVKRAFEYLSYSGKQIALGLVAVFLIVFSLFHIIQIQQNYFDWVGAGTRTKNFFISINSLYTNYWASKDIEFHFVDVPIRMGNAWIFPVGLEDAMWFAFRNDDAKIYKHNDLESALKFTPPNSSIPILKFNEDGTVVLIDRNLNP